MDTCVMELIIHENGMREVKVAEGMVLTNGEAFSDVGGSVYLSVNDSLDNWHEITAEEYQQKLAEEEARMEAERDAI